MALTVELVCVCILVFVYQQQVLGFKRDRDRCPEVIRDRRDPVSILKDMCYMYVGQEKYWDEARDYCWNLGGELVSIENKQTMDHIKSKFLNVNGGTHSKNGVWIGAKFNDNSDEWLWTTGKKIRYSYWASGQPSKSLLGISFEDCGVMRRRDGWRWHDYKCHFMGYTYDFICQFPIAGGEAAVQPEHHTAANSVDNGNTMVLGIIIGTGIFILLLVILTFLIYRYLQKKKYSREIPAANYGNENYVDANNYNNSHSTAVFHNRPRDSDVYLTPAEVNTLYEEVNKPNSHITNPNHVTCPLLVNIPNQNRDNVRQAGEGSSAESVVISGASSQAETPAIPPLPSTSTIPSIMETSTRSVNEYVDMASGVAIPPLPISDADKMASNVNTAKDQKGADADDCAKPSTGSPVYSNVDSISSTHKDSISSNGIYEDIP